MSNYKPSFFKNDPGQMFRTSLTTRSPSRTVKLSTVWVPSQCRSIFDNLENSKLQDHTLHLHGGHSLERKRKQEWKTERYLFHPVSLQSVEDEDIRRAVFVVLVQQSFLAILKKMIQFQICFQLLSGQDDNEMFAGVEFWNADVVGGGKLC